MNTSKIYTAAAASSGSLSLYPAGAASAPVSTSLQFSAATTRANNAVLLLAADGTGFKVLNSSAGSAHFILDVNGYFE